MILQHSHKCDGYLHQLFDLIPEKKHLGKRYGLLSLYTIMSYSNVQYM